MLNPKRGNAWIKHAAGAAWMIKMRGPDSYASDFERSLLMCNLGPIVSTIHIRVLVVFTSRGKLWLTDVLDR